MNVQAKITPQRKKKQVEEKIAVMPEKRRGRRPKAAETGQLSFFERLLVDNEARKQLAFLLRISELDSDWRGLVSVPPGTLLETIVEGFRSRTNIPLELPFFTTLHYISSRLLRDNVTLDLQGNTLKPDLWNVVLAESGSAKTFSLSTIRKMIDEPDGMPEAASTAKFVELLASYNNGGYVQDEFGKFIKSIDQQPQLQELKGVFLKLYDGHRIERQTVKKSVVIDDPSLAILGLSVLETFVDELPEGSLVDGFAQRFTYVIASKDPKRSMIDYPIYSLNSFTPEVQKGWADLVECIQPGATYVVTDDAIKAYVTAFRNFVPEFEDNIPESFYRRILWRGVRYALIYHILLGKKNLEIDVVDMGWAMRILKIHLRDVSELLTKHNMPELGRTVENVRAVMDRIQAREGRPATPREVVQNVRGIKFVKDAQALMQLARM